MSTGHVLTLVSLFGSLQALLLGIATWSGLGSAGDRVQRHLLAALFVMLGLVVAVISLDHAGWLPPTVPVGWIEYSLSLVFPPTFLLYAHRVVRRSPVHRRQALHFLVPALWLVASLATGNLRSPVTWLPIGLIVLYQVAYTLRVGWLAYLRAPVGAAPGLPLLRWWTVGLVIVHLSQGVRFAFHRIEALDDVVPLTSTAVLYGVVFLALRRSRVLQPPPPPYATSALGREEALAAAARVRRLMAEERLYLDPELKLDTLAARAGLSRSHASQVVNQELGTNFNDLVNRYRIEEAVTLLSDPALDHLTVDAIGERAGFASRSVFYQAFRRETGHTPGQYRARERS